MPRSLLAVIFVLLVLHQDNWFWTDDRLVFGFIPVGLFYHACISLIAGATWFWATKYCWPEGLDTEPTDSPAKTAATTHTTTNEELA